MPRCPINTAPSRRARARTLACAAKVTPTFAPDGNSLAGLGMPGGYIGRPFPRSRPYVLAAVAGQCGSARARLGPDARPMIAVDRQGRVRSRSTYSRTRSSTVRCCSRAPTDGGRSFATPSADHGGCAKASAFRQSRFDPDGSLFAAWLDKRNRAPAKAQDEPVCRRGAGLCMVERSRGDIFGHQPRAGQHLRMLPPRA